MPERVEPVLRMLHVAAKARATGLATTENGAARLLAASGDKALLAETLSTLGDDELSRTRDLEPALLHIEKSDVEPSSSWAVALPGEARETRLFLVACSVSGETGGHQLRETLRDGARLAALALGGNSIDAPTDAGRGSDDLAEPMPRDVAIRIIEHARAAAPTKARTALMLLDLDRFRAINDALGMGAGDALLSMTAARLQAILKPEERLVRLEGDRFVIVLRRARTQLQPFAQAALKAIGSPVRLGGKSVSIQACIGIVANPPVEVPTSIVLLQADTALKRAKQIGRNHVVVHEPEFDAAILEKSQLELELSDAPANGQMRLVYQPYMDLASRNISGCEALLRWRHPKRGEIHPDTFIPIAEATSLILPLGAWALRRACADAMTWPPHLILSVNISALQFHQASFEAQVDAALSKSGFPPERLELEITESVLMRDNSETIAQIQSLVDQGVRIALDDFGTGYSALAYLARLPHHRIKLDKSFVKDLNNPATSELIRAIISSARSTGVAVTAEGVERSEQLEQLSDIGFTHAQGFAVGAPKERQAVAVTPVEAEIA